MIFDVLRDKIVEILNVDPKESLLIRQTLKAQYPIRHLSMN